MRFRPAAAVEVSRVSRQIVMASIASVRLYLHNQLNSAPQHYAGLPIEFRFQDCRTLTVSFDGIVAAGMFEHVGRKNYRAYMAVAHRCPTEAGIYTGEHQAILALSSHYNSWPSQLLLINGQRDSVC